jgi:hypothetical protein
MIMYGGYDKKLIASAKLVSMEKYGYAYSEDLDLVQGALSNEVEVEGLEGGRARVTYNGKPFEVTVRGHMPGKKTAPTTIQEKTEEQHQRMKKIAEGERPGWVSVWDAANH